MQTPMVALTANTFCVRNYCRREEAKQVAKVTENFPLETFRRDNAVVYGNC
jgi:hypothetical protein